MWEFVTRDNDGNITLRANLSDIQYSWKMRLQENTFDVGWNDEMVRHIYGYGRHVLAMGLHDPSPPTNLRCALADDNKDKKIWNALYQEEYEGLLRLNVFSEINTDEYNALLRKHGDGAQVISTMNVLTIKPDMEGNKVRAKSRSIALCNVEK